MVVIAGGRRSIGARLLAVLAVMFAAAPAGATRAVAAPGGPGGLHVPVLMYHFIRVNPVQSDVLGFHLSVTPANFSEQIALLSVTGHHAVSIDDVVNAMDHGAPLPPNPVVLTFDDGYDNFATAATPMLRALGMTGTDFVVPGVTGTSGFMTVDQIREVVREGMSVGAHTMHHRDLSSLSDVAAQAEIQGSRDQLRQWTGTPVDTFAYPYGKLNERTPGLVAQSGFVAAFTTVEGALESPSNRETMPRVRVDGGDTLSSFAGKLGIRLPPRADHVFWSVLDLTASAALHGSTVGMAASPDGGYFVAGRGGTVRTFGPAVDAGSVTGELNAPIIGMAPSPTGKGYWLAAADGGVFPMGDAGGYGSAGGIRLNRPIVGIMATPTGHGYWLVASDGGVFPYGDATGYGSTGGIRLNRPVVAAAATPSGHGYWLTASDGGVFPFGDAAGYGSTGSVRLNQPIVGMAAPPDGTGYWLTAADGGVFPFGDATGYGSTGGVRLNSPIVGVAASTDGHGYWLVAADGGIFPFGDAPGYGSAATPPSTQPGVTLGGD